MEIRQRDNVLVATPHLSASDEDRQNARLRELVDKLLADHDVADSVLWYYTPMATAFTDHLSAAAIVYDCMDELSAFKGASPQLKSREADLMRRASLVLTGGQSLYEAKRAHHHNIHAFPSSVDVDHFAKARRIVTDPLDQAPIPRPRLGFFGVIDERMDLNLLRSLADARPHWHIVMIGPTVKIDAASLPARHNIHYLGAKTYDELPSYIGGWDVALLPFARNEATQFISPTKTPEYLAAGRPIVSTSIRDVVRPYGHEQLARIADEPRAFVAACEAALAEDAADRITRGDAFLRQMSWDGTWNRIQRLVDAVSTPPDAAGESVAAAM
jgi:UDP-galactopyranose mutase